nr:integrase core domain-containing protein [Defluviimonas salinarum]
MFRILADAAEKLEAWRRCDNEQRPHAALENLAPNAFAALPKPA